MISSASTLFLAILVLTTSVFGAPMRIPVVPSEVVARTESAPQLVTKAAVVDVQPFHRRSGLGTFNRRSARLLTEREPLPETTEVPVARDLVEEPEVRRRYPRRVYHEYYEKREPQPEPADVPAPVVQKREERPRAYPRRIYYEHYEKRAPGPEPAINVQDITISFNKAHSSNNLQDLVAANNNQLVSSMTQTIPVPGLASAQTFDNLQGLAAANNIQLVSSVTQTIPASGSATSATGIVASAATSSTVTPTASVIMVMESAVSTATASEVAVTASSTPASASVVVTGSSTSASPPMVTIAVSSTSASPPVVTLDASSTSASSSVGTMTGSSTSASPSVGTMTGSATSTAQAVDTATATPSSTSSSAAPAATATDSTATPGVIGQVNSNQPTVDISQPSGGTVSFVPAPRGATMTEPFLRRSAYSGATWASFIRRQSN